MTISLTVPTESAGDIAISPERVVLSPEPTYSRQSVITASIEMATRNREKLMLCGCEARLRPQP